ncbi:ribonuclease H family protein [Liquorilactobacillus uvarum]|uniref:ribonuclease H family protein n=1 Tax=Liquorilactobacillus uvarum TaxID=303240 RepID=UPI00288ACA1D|nr:ribonuclease H family protein [Liquorilactobacillus uvarum]
MEEQTIAYRFYAVARGRNKGIYTEWSECLKQINGFRQARYKGFQDKRAAKEWIKTVSTTEKPAVTDYNQEKRNSMSDALEAEIRLWTDGGSRNHGNKLGQHVKKDDKAAWAFLIEMDGKRISRSGGELGATNNKMEVMALLRALTYLNEHRCQGKSILATLDSRYVLDAIQKKWVFGWKKRGWKTSAGTEVANKELWMKMVAILPQFSRLTFQWTKGHQKNEGNIFVDQLLNQTMDEMDE